MKIGIGFPARSYEQVGEYVEEARKYPFESFISYGDLGDAPPYLALGMYASQLAESEIRHVGPLGSPVGRMDPELLGSHARLFEQAVGDKALAGLVRGAFLEQIGQKPASLTDMEAAIDEVRGQAPISKLAVGGFGPKILTLAERKGADYIKLGGSASSELARHALSQLQVAPPKIILGAVTILDTDRKKARATARAEVAKYLAVVGPLDPTLTTDQRDSLSRFMQAYSNGEESENHISDALLDAFSYSGTHEDIYKRIRQTDKCVDHIQFGTPHGLGAIKQNVKQLGEIAEALAEEKL